MMSSHLCKVFIIWIRRGRGTTAGPRLRGHVSDRQVLLLVGVHRVVEVGRVVRIRKEVEVVHVEVSDERQLVVGERPLVRSLRKRARKLGDAVALENIVSILSLSFPFVVLSDKKSGAIVILHYCSYCRCWFIV